MYKFPVELNQTQLSGRLSARTPIYLLNSVYKLFALFAENIQYIDTSLMFAGPPLHSSHASYLTLNIFPRLYAF